jgi:hypothetical protein
MLSDDEALEAEADDKTSRHTMKLEIQQQL